MSLRDLFISVKRYYKYISTQQCHSKIYKTTKATCEIFEVTKSQQHYKTGNKNYAAE